MQRNHSSTLPDQREQEGEEQNSKEFKETEIVQALRLGQEVGGNRNGLGNSYIMVDKLNYG